MNKFAYSISEIEELVPLGRTKIYEEIAKGNLAIRKVGRRTLVLAVDLERFLESLPRPRVRKGQF